MNTRAFGVSIVLAAFALLFAASAMAQPAPGIWHIEVWEQNDGGPYDQNAAFCEAGAPCTLVTDIEVCIGGDCQTTGGDGQVDFVDLAPDTYQACIADPRYAVVSGSAGGDSVSASCVERVVTEGNEQTTAMYVELQTADFEVVVTESADPVTAGSGSLNLLHTVVVTNNGPNAPADADGTFDVEWPAGTTFEGVAFTYDAACPGGPDPVEAGAAGGAFTGTFAERPAGAGSPFNGLWVATNFANGGVGRVCVYFTVGPDTVPGTDVITTSAAVTSTEFPDPDDGNDSDSESTSVEAETDFGVAITESVDPVVAGSVPTPNLLHQLTLTNLGPSTAPASGVTFDWTATWPSGVSLDAVTSAPLNVNCPASPGATEDPQAANWAVDVGSFEAPAGLAGGSTGDTYFNLVPFGPGDFGVVCFYFTATLQADEGDDVITTSADITATTYTDPNGANDTAEESTGIRWPTATFRVLKEYSSGGAGPVDVTLECSDTTGLLEYDPQSGTTTTSLTVRRFDIGLGGTTSCTVIEEVPSGYYQAARTADCDVDPVGDQGSYACTITNAETRVTFTVQKLFMLGHEADEVELNISCNTGLPLDQTHTATLVPGPLGSPQTYETEFVVHSFDDGELDCEVFETPVAGYIPSYNCDIDVGGTCDAGDSFAVYDAPYFEDPDDFFDGPCEYDDVALDVQVVPDEKPWETLCVIRNYPAPTSVNIAKEWVIEGSSTPDGVSTYYEIDLYCDSPIIDVNNSGNVSDYGDTWHASWSDNGDALFDASVIPGYPASECYVEETVFDDAVEVDSDCGDESNPFALSIGNPYECTITNTIFYEGIPTLNQYGLALLALLMLGVGFVGFRRYS